jgi:protease-4
VVGDPQKLDAEIIENILLDSRTGMLAADRVKAILLHFNTPGGTVVDADAIYEMLLNYKATYKVPIFGFVEGLCASGGMYIASATDQMFAGPASMIGSVGVIIGPFFNVSAVMDKVGITAKTITQGLDKDMMSPFRPWKEGEDASIQAVTAFMYQRFVDVVTKARPQLDRTKLVEQYGAQVYDCVTAAQYGYIDHAMSSRSDALKALLASAQIDGSYQVVSLIPKNPWLSGLVSGRSPLLTGRMEHSLDHIAFRIQQQPCYLYTLSTP